MLFPASLSAAASAGCYFGISMPSVAAASDPALSAGWAFATTASFASAAASTTVPSAAGSALGVMAGASAVDASDAMTDFWRNHEKKHLYLFHSVLVGAKFRAATERLIAPPGGTGRKTGGWNLVTGNEPDRVPSRNSFG